MNVWAKRYFWRQLMESMKTHFQSSRFNESLSCGSCNDKRDEVTTLNVPALSAYYKVILNFLFLKYEIIPTICQLQGCLMNNFIFRLAGNFKEFWHIYYLWLKRSANRSWPLSLTLTYMFTNHVHCTLALKIRLRLKLTALRWCWWWNRVLQVFQS